MFDELKRELRKLDGSHEIRVSIPPDAEGYLDRECPSDDCLAQFKVLEQDWKDKVREEEAFCPFCRHSAGSRKWFTQEQVEHIREAGLAFVGQRIRGAMKRDAQNWNRRQRRDSFLQITLKVDNKPQKVLLPLAATDRMRLKITCPACTCRYAVVGAAFFCPACGHNAADLMFGQSVAAVVNALDALHAVRAAIGDRDTAETTVRLIIENGLQNAVTTFQRYAEVLYAGYPQVKPPRRNAFQNLAEGSELWRSATGKAYDTYLGDAELVALTRFFQQRHLLAHTQGLVDGTYVEKTGDNSYRVGQRIVVREASVRDCLRLIEKLGNAMAVEDAAIIP
jgi:hypothetical protein